MKYFLIRQPSEKKEVGINDGTVQAEIIDSRWKNKKELKRYVNEYLLGVYQTNEMLERGEEVAPPAFEYIKIRPQAKLTDFLSFAESYAGGGYLLSQKVCTILSHFNFKGRLYADMPTFHKDVKIEGYSNMHLFPQKFKEAVIIEKSVFFTGNRLVGKTFWQANTLEEYLGLKRSQFMRMETLCLKAGSTAGLDILTFDLLPKIYVSERLKNALESEGVTGIKFMEPNEPKLTFED